MIENKKINIVVDCPPSLEKTVSRLLEVIPAKVGVEMNILPGLGYIPTWKIYDGDNVLLETESYEAFDKNLKIVLREEKKRGIKQ